MTIALIFNHSVSAQKNVSVNLSTGTAHVSIPVYTVSNGGVAVPVSLEYDAKGLRIGEMESVVGSGWQLNAGGAITRNVRDLPDDIKSDQSSNSRLGWLYNTNATKINNITIANDNNTTTCTDETTDINNITTNLSDNSDMEPDIYNVQAPGLGCQLVYDQINAVFRPIPYQDIQVSYTLNAAQNSITSFKIINDKGIIYTFNVTEPVTQTTSSTAPANIAYFKRKYNLYQHGILYNSKWYLSTIQDPNGNYILLSYSPLGTINTTAPAQLVYGAASNRFKDTILYTITQSYSPQRIGTIDVLSKLTHTDVDHVSFNYAVTTDAVNYIISSITLHGSNRVLALTYQKCIGRTRDYLTNFGESGCSSGGINYNSNLYSFAYSGVNFTSGLLVPDFSLYGGYQDFWGYVNLQNESAAPPAYVYPDNASYPNLERYRLFPISGYPGTSYALNGSTPSVDASITTGTLNQITYPTGGTTTLTLEPNDFYDVSASATFQGGGLRIKQITDYDGVNATNNIVRNYTYTDPTTSITTGKPISLPVIAFTIPYTGTATGLDYWNYSTVRLPPGFADQDESVVYGKVTVQQTGAGKTISQFTTPGTFWDASASPDWTPTIANAGRSISGGSCPAIGSLKNAKYGYPIVPNINYDFERGLPTTVTSYNESGNIVSQANYVYQRSYITPLAITAYKFDNNSTAEGYAKYQIYTTTSELISSVTKFVNDLSNTTNDATKQIISTNNYYYLGTNHKLPTKTETVNTDGSIDRAYIKYTKDYTYANDDFYDQPMGSIKALAGLNINIPVETYSTVTRSGTEKATGASLVKFSSFPSGVTSPANIYLPAQSLNFVSSAGITSFPVSYNNGGQFASYSGYIPRANFTAYNSSGSLLTKDDNYKNNSSKIVDDNLLSPVATIVNAKYNEISYTNFEGSEPKYGFSVSGSTYNSSISRTGKYCLSFPTTGSLLDTISLKANAKNYTFSCWVNASASGSLTISLYNTSGTLFGTQTLNFTGSGSGWNYYEQKINTNGITSSFSIKLLTSLSINIDDILFYPETTEVNTFAYDPLLFYKTAETNTNGVSKYYSYDQYYRLQYVYDQDKNIVLKKTYVSANTIASGLISANFTVSPSTGLINGTPITFSGLTGSGTCTPGTNYSWAFGDGGTYGPSLTNTNPVHTYSTAGTYNPVFTVSNSIFGTKTATQQLIVSFTVNACQSGVYGFTPPNGAVLTWACSPNPNNNTNSYFTISSITGAPSSPTYTYQWQIYYTDTGGSGSGVWTNTGGSTTQLVIPFVKSTFRPYNIQCIVTDTHSGTTGTSGLFSVSIGGS